ncbi:hypothetical protein EIL87_26255 [Saccharopolyspora rhizosphaerae]|uniref:Uncharacterized protein n=1 Tax=Saccharopolyspora rhizosphaerae TaxID=2492662 RepID=A0A426JIX3_9PSEU|nr:hypothetical protein [Saccharopolyspora rhizosphaerae]RRO13142.1 hypothetical protein EIL87_26255 [Saccharopolyspora rhizosphaerae]
MTRISVDVVDEISDQQINHLREVLERQLRQMGLRGQVTTPPRFLLQQHSEPGNLTVAVHAEFDPIDRDEPCRFIDERRDAWVFTPAELLDMMANPKRVFPQVCGRCTSRPGASIVRRVLRAYKLGQWPDEEQRREVVKELRDQFRDKGYY